MLIKEIEIEIERERERTTERDIELIRCSHSLLRDSIEIGRIIGRAFAMTFRRSIDGSRDGRFPHDEAVSSSDSEAGRGVRVGTLIPAVTGHRGRVASV